MGGIHGRSKRTYAWCCRHARLPLGLASRGRSGSSPTSGHCSVGAVRVSNNISIILTMKKLGFEWNHASDPEISCQSSCDTKQHHDMITQSVRSFCQQHFVSNIEAWIHFRYRIFGICEDILSLSCLYPYVAFYFYVVPQAVFSCRCSYGVV